MMGKLEQLLEMGMMMPVALVDDAVAAQASAEMVLDVGVGGKGLRLTPRGVLSPEDVLEKINEALPARPGLGCLLLDLAGVEYMDHLSLSALIVVLRGHRNLFRRIKLNGLPCWAQERLCQTGAENLLGRGWSQQDGRDWMAFHSVATTG